MPIDHHHSPIVVFGAGGRAGTAILAEVARRGRPVTAVVRDPARHPGLADLGAASRSPPAISPTRAASRR
ncbi:NmrA family NAD(P)-binding protein [Catenulispora yoronensis]